MSFDLEYKKMLQFVIRDGVLTKNKRTGEEVIENFGYSFKWDTKYLPVLTIRQIKPLNAIAEAIWMIIGEKSISWLESYTKIWNMFSDHNNNVDSAYGYRIRKEYKIDQFRHVINKLKMDETNRQCCISIWNPMKDNVISQKNTPCCTMLQFVILKGKLNMYVHFRSNDLILGLPFDILTMFFLLKIISTTLLMDSGEIFYTISNLHIYTNHIQEFGKINKPTFEKFESKGKYPDLFECEQFRDYSVYKLLEIIKRSGYNYKDYPKLNFKIAL